MESNRLSGAGKLNEKVGTKPALWQTNNTLKTAWPSWPMTAWGIEEQVENCYTFEGHIFTRYGDPVLENSDSLPNAILPTGDVF